jgi:hypothetical protein
MHFWLCQANSEHPLTKAIVEHTKKLREQYAANSGHIMESKDFEVHPGAELFPTEYFITFNIGLLWNRLQREASLE